MAEESCNQDLSETASWEQRAGKLIYHGGRSSATTKNGVAPSALMAVVVQTRTDDDAGASGTYTVCGREGGGSVGRCVCGWFAQSSWC